MFPVSLNYSGDVCIQICETHDFDQKILTLSAGTVLYSEVRSTLLHFIDLPSKTKS